MKDASDAFPSLILFQILLDFLYKFFMVTNLSQENHFW